MIVMDSLELTKYAIPSVDMAIQWRYVDEEQWRDYNPGRGWTFKIDHPVLGSYIPSKVAMVNGNLHFFYYVNQGLPDPVRPFSDGHCYVWVAQWSPTRVWRYPADVRVFIDQLVVGDNIYYVFVTSESEYQKLTSAPERTIELVDDLAIYKEGL
jgi:hypothetical protein